MVTGLMLVGISYLFVLFYFYFSFQSFFTIRNWETNMAQISYNINDARISNNVWSILQRANKLADIRAVKEKSPEEVVLIRNYWKKDILQNYEEKPRN